MKLPSVVVVANVGPDNTCTLTYESPPRNPRPVPTWLDEAVTGNADDVSTPDDFSSA